MSDDFETKPPSANHSRRQIIIGGALLVTAAASAALVPRRKNDILGVRKLEKLTPTEVGPWTFSSKSGLVIPPSDELSDKLYSQLLTRVYEAKDLPPIMLLIAQSGGQDGVLQVHRPEVCYPAGGYKLSNSRVHHLQIGPRRVTTRVMSAHGPERSEQLLYWTRIGSSLPTTWAEQRLAVAKANLQGDIPDAVLIRVSTVSEEPAALRYVNEFAKALVAVSSPIMQRVLVGDVIYQNRRA